MKYYTSLIITAIVFLSCQQRKSFYDKPQIIDFGSNKAEIQETLKNYCDSMTIIQNQPMQLPTAKNNQSQIDCHGFYYAGKKRKMELVFADDILDIIWILVEEDELTKIENHFNLCYGNPKHKDSLNIYYIKNNASIRKSPAEVQFFSKRLYIPYKKWLHQQ